MREIKFRAWSPSNAGWCEDWSISSYEKILDLNAERMYDDLILSQYTGLKDKNGKEIYEGDIIRFSRWETGVEVYETDQGPTQYNYTPVEWSDVACGFSPMAEGPVDYDTISVIGNIYENPELLNIQLSDSCPDNQTK